MEPTAMPIRKLIESVENGQVRIPAFQRDFVWDPERVAHFVDSIYKQYPFGSLLFWRARELLEHERRLGPYELPPLKDDYPIDYVLDGQQRVTSIFASFQTDLPRPHEKEWTEIYFDYRRDIDPQDSSFFPLSAADADPNQFFPVSVLFDSTAYRVATENIDKDYLPRIDDLQSRVKETLIPVQVLPTDDRATVAIVFERINHQGVPLDTLQLLTAWTWSDDFDLQRRFEDLREALEDHGFAGVGEDTSLVLRCCSAILTGVPRSDTLIGLNGADVRERFDEVENGIKGAIDFLRQQIGVETLRNLPYPAMLIPLAVYFAIAGNKQLVVPDEHRIRIVRWFWRSCLSERYSGQTNRVAEQDAAEIRKLRGNEVNNLGDFAVALGDSFFLNEFRLGSARSATAILMLASADPRSFISGNRVELGPVLQGYNRHEFHHMFPKAVLQDRGVDKSRTNAIANMCILSRADNNRIRRKPPSKYREEMPSDDDALREILDSAVAGEILFSDDFDAFLADRVERLKALAAHLAHLEDDVAAAAS